MSEEFESLEQSALSALEIADDWQRKGNSRSELSCRGSALSRLLGVAVQRFPNAELGMAYLFGHKIGTIVDRVAELNLGLYESLLKDRRVVATVDTDVTQVHIAWLADRMTSADLLLKICSDPFVRGFFPATRFWAEYIRAVVCLRDKKTYEPGALKARGYEAYWVPYLELISAITSGSDISIPRDLIAEGFRKRNRDRRLTDWRMIDGDGNRPVQWDFREYSILRVAGLSS